MADFILNYRITTLIPDVKFNAASAIFQSEIDSVMRNKTKEDLRKLFKRTIAGWKSYPIFRGTINKSTNYYIRLAFRPTGEHKQKWIWVSRGTRPHMIYPRGNYRLRFRSRYTPSTRVGSIDSQANRKFGPIITPNFVSHPGTEARDFEGQIIDLYFDTFVKDMFKAIQIAATKMMGK